MHIISLEMMGRRRKQLLDDLKEKRECLIQREALDHTLWRTRFGRKYGGVVGHTKE